jgi:NDP-sugar pyrophosphorylase family protein
MKILIMCGGKGKRLAPLTESVPKPLLPVNGKPLIAIKIEHYLNSGFKEFVVCTGYKGNLIKEALDPYNAKARFYFSDAGVEAGILTRLYEASDWYGDNVIMTYGDTFADIDLKKLTRTHKESDNLATLVVAPIQNPFGLIEFDSNLKVQSYREKPILKYYIGYAVIRKESFELMPPAILDYPDGAGLVTYFKILMAMEKLGVYYHSGLQTTFNTAKELEETQEHLNEFFSVPESFKPEKN